MRTKYIERVDRLRALRQSTSEEAARASVGVGSGLETKHVRLYYRGEALEQVARYIRLYDAIAEEKSGRPNTPYSKNWYLELLVGYLINQPAVLKLQKEHDKGEVMVTEATSAARPSLDEGKHTCLLCR